MRLASILLPGDPEPWSALGFSPDGDGRLRFSNGALEFGDDVRGLAVDAPTGDTLPVEVEGIPIRRGSVLRGSDHRNGAVELDHLVIMTPALDRTSAAITEALGLEQRRVRETPEVRQAFHRFADHGGTRGCIVEVVQDSRVGHPAIWGVVFIVDDLDAAVAAAPELISQPTPAVQPGRRIATVSRAAGLSTAVALMSR